MTLALQVMFIALNKPEQILAAKVGGEKKKSRDLGFGFLLP